MTDEEIRTQWVAIELEAVGLSADGPKIQPYLVAIVTSIADLTDAKACAAALQQSSCALRARRVIQTWLSRMGLRPLAILEDPYRQGRAVSDVEEIGRAAGAWCAPGRAPLLGDFATILSPTHVLAVTAIDGSTYTTVQGGERDGAGGECIALVTRRFFAGPPKRFDTRPVYGSFDVVAFSRWALDRG